MGYEMKRYRIQIKCLEDIMPGNGESVPGIIDNDILMDEYGLPYMHAKTFKGHLREQMSLLQYNGAYTDIKIDTLLGGSNIDASATGKIKVSGIHVSEQVRAAISAAIRKGEVTREEIINSLTVIRQFTRINEDGVADNGSLRTVRMAAAGLSFETFIFTEGLTQEEYHFINDAVRGIQHIGTYKSKGKGTVQCLVIDDYSGEVNRMSASCQQEESGSMQSFGMKNYVCYKIRLEEPVKMGTEGNQANTEALTYLAGSSLRGTWVAEYIKKYEPQRELFLNTFFYDAYPYLEGGEKVAGKAFIPVPSVYYADKHKKREGEKNDQPYEAYCRLDEKPKEGEQRIGRERYCHLEDNTEKTEGCRLELLGVRREGYLHTALRKENGDGTVEKQKMFRYEAIAPGQTFVGFIRCKDEETAGQFVDVMRVDPQDKDSDQASEDAGKVVYIGGSRGSGYGRCHICDVECITEEEAQRYFASAKRKKREGGFTIYALSNLLPTDEYGAEIGKIDEKYLEKALGISKVRLSKAFVNMMRSSGFNNVWRAGSVQRTGVGAGSVYVYECCGIPSEEGIRKLEKEGIGQRRQEGFGRILFDLDMDRDKIEVAKASAKPTDQVKDDGEELSLLKDSLMPLDSENKKILLFIETRINKMKLDNAVRSAAFDCAAESERIISSNQLSLTQAARLYNLLSELTGKYGDDEAAAKRKLEEFLGSLKTKTGKAYGVARLQVAVGSGSERKNMILSTILRNICQDRAEESTDKETGIRYPAFDLVSIRKFKEFHFSGLSGTDELRISGELRNSDRFGKSDGRACTFVFAGRSSFWINCEFVLQTMRYLMRRKGGRR